MRKIMFLGAICLGTTLLWPAGMVKPLNVKPGFWQTTITTNVSGQPSSAIPPDTLARMNPQQRAMAEAYLKGLPAALSGTRTYKKCVTQKDLNQDLFNNDKKECTVTILDSTGTKLDFHAVCAYPNGEKVDITGHGEAADSENWKGSGHMIMTGGGHAMKEDVTLAGKWLGASCPATN